MNLYRLRLNIHSSWLTPWQADTMSGLLCWTLARTEGADVLRREILDPAARGSPPFVLSDAFPAGLLPVPAVLRAMPWPEEQRKRVKRARWLLAEDFYKLQKGVLPPAERLLPDDEVHQKLLNLRNKLDRTSGTTGAAGEGGLFSVEETFLARDWLRPQERPNRPSELVL
jgi:CRISPR-associated protein Csm4